MAWMRRVMARERERWLWSGVARELIVLNEEEWVKAGREGGGRDAAISPQRGNGRGERVQ
jgi:hypothetical protein